MRRRRAIRSFGFERLTKYVPEYDVVAGHRVRRADPLIRRINGKAWTLLVRLLLGITISDIDCGFKLFKREKLRGDGFAGHGAMISTELMARLAGRNAKVKEVDVKHLPRLRASSRAPISRWSHAHSGADNALSRAEG